MSELTVPEVGESISEVQIGRWLKKDGDSVARDEDLVEIETEKASVTVPSPEDGVLSIVKQEGEFADVGEVIARIEAGEEAETRGAAKEEGTDEAEEQEEREEQDDPGAEETSESGGEDGDGHEATPRETGGEEQPPAGEEPSDDESEDEAGPRAMPAAARLLDEHGLNAADIEATGPGGRLLKEDVQRYLAQGEARQAARAALEGDTTEAVAEDEGESSGVCRPAEDAGEQGRGPAAPPSSRTEDVRPMSMVRRTIARRLVEAQAEAALLTTFNEVDMQPVIDLRGRYREEFRDKHGVKLGFMSFFVKASVAALQRFPAVNSEIRDRNVVTKHYYDVGIAVGGGKGLVVPVIRDADRLGFADIERAIADFGERAERNEIEPEELEGGTFTISNGGIYGSLLSTPIVNPPQSGILGMHAIQERPVVRDGEIVVRPMMYVALTYDHRIVDGREAVTFLRTIKEVLEEPARLFLEI